MTIASVLGVFGLSCAMATSASAVKLEMKVTFADPSVVGTSGTVGSIELTGSEFGPDPLVVTPGSLRLFPACNTIDCSGTEPGVFAVGPSGTGAIDTACQGVTFTMTADPVTGEINITSPDPIVLDDSPPGIDRCKINLVYSTLSLPTVDPDVLPGAQTYQLVRADATAGVAFLSAGDAGEVTVRPAPPPPAAPAAQAPVAEPKRKKCKKSKKRNNRASAAKKRKCKRK